jgi:hypothetical protein
MSTMIYFLVIKYNGRMHHAVFVFQLVVYMDDANVMLIQLHFVLNELSL